MQINQFSPAQKATFLAWLNANASELTEDAAAGLANEVASPAYKVWRPSLGKHILIEQSSQDSADAEDLVYALRDRARDFQRRRYRASRH